MNKMIDNEIEIGRPEMALKMEWVKLAYNETDDLNDAITRLMALRAKGN